MKKRINRDKNRYARKQRKPDCTEDNLPHNRFAVLWDILKVRYDIFLKTSGILFLFSLPLFAAIIFYTLSKNALVSNYADGLIDFDTYRSSALSSILLFTGIESLCFWIIAIGVSGIQRVMKRLVFYESIQFKEDFLRGIKGNIKQTFLVFVLFSVVYFAAVSMSEIAVISGTSDLSSTLVMFLPLFLLIIVFLPIFLLTLAEIPIYANTSGQNFRNALVCYVRKFYITLPCLLVLLSPLLLFLIGNVYVTIASFLVIVLIIIPIEFAVIHIYSCWLFDKYINVRLHPEIVDKGIIRINK